jgi:hypothetical protein
MIASSNSVARSGGQIFEPGPHINAALANRSARFAARWFDLAFIINAFDFAVLTSGHSKIGRGIDYRSDIL